MAVIWIESFDIYGTNKAFLAQRGYSDVGGAGSFLVNNPSVARTGNGCYQFANDGVFTFLTRVLDNPINRCVVGCAVNFLTTPNFASPGMPGFAIGGGATGFRIAINPNLGLNVYRNDVLIGNTPNNIITLGTYVYLEMKLDAGANGSIAIRRNNELVLTINNVNISPIASVSIARANISFQTAIFDDWYILDGSGTINNDFIGDRRVISLMPDADVAPQDWVLSSGSNGWSLIDELVPNDAGFIRADNSGDVSQFNKTDVPLDVNDVAAVCVVARAFKQSAGPATFRIGVNSNGNVQNSAEFAPNTTVAYFSRVFERNPDGNIPWTRLAVDNALIRFTREV